MNDVARAYRDLVPFLRSEWHRAPTPTGKPSKGPTYYAVTMCEYENEPGLTSSKATKGQRWACKTCFNFAEPVWTDSPDKCPSADEALHEYTAWVSKRGTKGKQPWRKGMMGNDIIR